MKKEPVFIGQAEHVDFPELGLSHIPARIDTGAKTSAIWASSIKETDGQLSFVLFDSKCAYYNGRTLTTNDYQLRIIASSTGVSEERYVVKLLIVLAGRKIRASFTLADRSAQTYPVLIGRRVLHGKFIVDVKQGKPLLDKEQKRSRTLQAKSKKSKEDTLKIAILSKGPANYSTRRLKEEALKRGHQVRIVNYAKCYVTLEKGNPIVNYKGEEITGIDVIIPRIASSLTKYGSAIVRQFEMQNVATTTSSIAIVRSRDKLRSMQLLAKDGIGIPKTVFARETADFDGVLEQVGGAPVIIKVARGTHGNGVVLAETRKAALAVMQAFYVEGVNFLVQEFIQESAGTDIRAFVVNGKVVASMKRQSLDDDFRSNLHQGGEGTLIELTDRERKTAQKAAKAMGLVIAGVDMMRSDRGPLVLEVNSSPGFGIEKVTGENVAEKIIEYVEQAAKSARRKDKVGA